MLWLWLPHLVVVVDDDRGSLEDLVDVVLVKPEGRGRGREGEGYISEQEGRGRVGGRVGKISKRRRVEISNEKV